MFARVFLGAKLAVFVWQEAREMGNANAFCILVLPLVVVVGNAVDNVRRIRRHRAAVRSLHTICTTEEDHAMVDAAVRQA